MIKLVTPLLAISASLLSGAAYAADAVTEPVYVPPESGWTFAVAPYLWMTSITGDIGQFGFEPIGVDASFIDILKNFDIGAMAVAEARNGRFGVAMDFMYAKLSAEGDTPLQFLADSVEVTSETLTVFAAGEYRMFESDQGSLDLMAGARLWSINTDVDPKGGPGDLLLFSDGDTWVDPIIGVKGRMNLSPNLYVTGWGMIGGFGVSSEFTWDVMAALGYQVNDRVSMVGGYRALGVDYSNNGFVFDVVEHGPILGAVIKF